MWLLLHLRCVNFKGKNINIILFIEWFIIYFTMCLTNLVLSLSSQSTIWLLHNGSFPKVPSSVSERLFSKRKCTSRLSPWSMSISMSLSMSLQQLIQLGTPCVVYHGIRTSSNLRSTSTFRLLQSRISHSFLIS